MNYALSYKQPTPKRLVLSLLSAPGMESITARQCVDWGCLFTIDPAAMRVAVGRMVKDQYLSSRRRGVYAIGPKGVVLSRTARSWVDAERRVCDWEGAWILAQTAHLGRSNKAALRSREHALRLEGFAQLHAGIWCRPGNFSEPLATTRKRLLSLGLDASALILRVDELLGMLVEPQTLWPRREREERYAMLTEAMRESVQRLADLDVEDAARETFLIGEAVIRQINADPLLPDAMIDALARRTMIATMLEYDVRGRDAWTRFQQMSE
ncbi:MAG: PaaX [Congregibacter sp.]